MRYQSQRLKIGRHQHVSRWLWFIYLALIGLGAGFFFFLQFIWALLSVRVEAGPTQADVLALWSAGAYSDVIAHLNTELEGHPLDPTQLTLLGLSHFYQALGYGDALDQKTDMDFAIVYLRKALLFSSVPALDRVYYVLGKSYFYKGRYYSDLAVEYLEKAIEENPNLENGYEYLGLAYNALSQFEKSFYAFQRAYGQRPTSLILYDMAEVSFKGNNIQVSRDYLLRLQGEYEAKGELVQKPDDNLMQKVWLLLGDISFKEGHYSNAQIFYEKVLVLNASNGLVYLKLGDVYDARDKDIVKARKAWRTATQLDPYLEEAVERLRRPVA